MMHTVETTELSLAARISALIADDQVVSRSTSGDLGEFSMACDNEGSIRLCLVMNDDECIDVSLDRRRRQPTEN